MGQAIVDPQELRRFASRLRHFSTEVLAQMQTVQRQLQALSASWRDQEHQKFAEEFEQQLTTFARFVESTGEYVPYLIMIGAVLTVIYRGEVFAEDTHSICCRRERAV